MVVGFLIPTFGFHTFARENRRNHPFFFKCQCYVPPGLLLEESGRQSADSFLSGTGGFFLWSEIDMCYYLF